MQDSSKKNANTNNTEKLDDTAYYDELYNDFPEDIKDILMETHPLFQEMYEAQQKWYQWIM